MKLRRRYSAATVAFVAAVACVGLWSGCVSHGLSIQDARTGAEQREFSSAQRARVDIRGGVGMVAGVAVRVVKLPERTTVYRKAFGRGFDAPFIQNMRSDFDPDPRSTTALVHQPTETMLPQLEPGEYAVELWTDGKLEDTQHLTVTAAPELVPEPPRFAAFATTTPTIEIKTGNGAPPTSAEVAAELLDDVVHLSSAQKEDALRIFAADRYQHGGPAAEVARLQEEQRGRIRALLTPEQRTLYDATPTLRGGGAELATLAVNVPEPAVIVGQSAAGVDVAQLQAVRREMVEYLKTAPVVAASFGEVKSVQSLGGQSQHKSGTGREPTWEGRFRFEITGDTRTGTVVVQWRRNGSGPFQVVQIQEPNGHVLALK